MSFARRLVHSALPALVVLAATSCAATSPPPAAGQKPVQPVRGQVFVKDQPAAGAFVLFIPVNEPATPTDPRPRATVEPDGSFQLSTYGENDGAPAGDYYVTVTWPTDGRDDEDKLQGRYNEPGKSKLRAAVKDGPNDLPPFKLK